ncbi:MAG TPA: hypothetical protein VI007_13095, partial [bacterium]
MIPARIWAAFMKNALEGVDVEEWSRPDLIVTVTVCGASGLLATSACPNPRSEVFIRGTEPTEYDRTVPADGMNGRTVSGNVPLQITAPGGGAVTSPFAIEGVTVPGATVTLNVMAEAGFLRVQAADAQPPVTADGRFSFVFRPSVRVSGVKYIVTVKVVAPDGQQSTASFTVTEQ